MSVRKPFKIPGSPNYYIEVNRRRESLRTADKIKAMARYREVLAEWHTAKAEQAHTPAITLASFAKEALEWSAGVHAEKTVAANRLALDKIIGHVGAHALITEISTRHLDALIGAEIKKGLSASSVNRMIRHLKAAFSKAVEWDYLAVNPCRKTKLLRIESKTPAFLTKEQAVTFLDSIQDRYLMLFIMAYLVTGRRRGELWELRWKDVDIERGKYYIRRSKSKTQRWYPMNQPFREILEELPREKDVNGKEKEDIRVFNKWDHPDTITKKTKAALRAAGLPAMKLHDMRHSFASMFVIDGGDIRTLKDLIGHSNIATTMIYAHLSDDHLTQEIGRVNLDVKGKSA